MFNVLRASFHTGQVAKAYSELRKNGPSRGRPKIDPSLCDLNGDCVGVCPSQAISIEQISRNVHRWQMNIARCVFCGLCLETCPSGAIRASDEFELATTTSNDLIISVLHEDRLPNVGSEEKANSIRVEGNAPPGIIPKSAKAETSDSARRRALGRSLHIRHMAGGSDNSCDWEISALLNPVYDVQRFGIDFVASPRHADLLLVTGSVTRHLQPALLATYEAMPSPRIVVAAGSEACGGGLLQGSYASGGGVDRFLPVDVYIPGDPPSPLALLHGLMIATEKLEPNMKRLDYLV